MKQRFYRAVKGNYYLSIADHPGTLTESDIIENITNMMILDLDEEEEINYKRIHESAVRFYYDNLDRILELIYPDTELTEAEPEEYEEATSLSFEEWMLYEFPHVEWD